MKNFNKKALTLIVATSLFAIEGFAQTSPGQVGQVTDTSVSTGAPATGNNPNYNSLPQNRTGAKRKNNNRGTTSQPSATPEGANANTGTTTPADINNMSPNPTGGVNGGTNNGNGTGTNGGNQ